MNKFVNDLYFLSIKSYLLDEKDTVELPSGNITIKGVKESDPSCLGSVVFISTVHNKEGESLHTEIFTKQSDLTIDELLNSSDVDRLRFLFRKNPPFIGKKFTSHSVTMNFSNESDKELAQLIDEICELARDEYHEMVGVQRHSKRHERTLK